MLPKTSIIVASMLFTDESKSYSPVSYQISELKSLPRHRYRMIDYRSRLKLSVTRLLHIIFSELASVVWSIHQNSSYGLLLEYPSANSIWNPSRSLPFELQQTIRLIQSVQSEVDELDKQIKLVIAEIDSLLLSIPGLFYTLVSVILAEIGDIKRFDNPAKLLAFAGMEPSNYQSGKYTATHTPTVKRGSTTSIAQPFCLLLLIIL